MIAYSKFYIIFATTQAIFQLKKSTKHQFEILKINI